MHGEGSTSPKSCGHSQPRLTAGRAIHAGEQRVSQQIPQALQATGLQLLTHFCQGIDGALGWSGNGIGPANGR